MMTTYRVSEIFQTIQGEGMMTGRPSTFVRLHGCSVGCPWCDTKYTWDGSPIPVDSASMLAGPGGLNRVATIALGELLRLIPDTQHVVLTGGEPFEQEMGPLIRALQERGHCVQVETSGTAPMPSVRPDWLTVSPKVGMPGGLSVLPEVLDVADEIKMPVGKQRDIKALDALLEQRGPLRPLVYLQPLSLSPSASSLCVQTALARGWRVSFQVHKLVGLR